MDQSRGSDAGQTSWEFGHAHIQLNTEENLLIGAVGDQGYSPVAFHWPDPPLGARAQGPHAGVHVASAWGLWSDSHVLFLLRCI